MRAAIFIDGGYFLSLMKKNNIEPNYKNLADYLLKPLRKSVPLDLLRCYFYYCAPWTSPEPTASERRRMEEHHNFMNEISHLERWGVRLGKLQKRWDGHKEYFEQKRVDVLLSVDMARHSAAGHIQHVILIAGDSDFIPALEATKESGATVTLWYGGDSVHKDLLDMADITHQFDFKKIPRKKTGLFSKKPAKPAPRPAAKRAPIQNRKKLEVQKRYRSRTPNKNNNNNNNNNNKQS